MNKILTKEEAILRVHDLKILLKSEKVNPTTTWDKMIIEFYEMEIDELCKKFHLYEEPWLIYGCTKEQYEKECEIIKESSQGLNERFPRNL